MEQNIWIERYKKWCTHFQNPTLSFLTLGNEASITLSVCVRAAVALSKLFAHLSFALGEAQEGLSP